MILLVYSGCDCSTMRRNKTIIMFIPLTIIIIIGIGVVGVVGVLLECCDGCSVCVGCGVHLCMCIYRLID
jgi:hypothetical protein